MRTITERGSLWELAVLSLVREEPMHPYLMQRLLRERHKDDVLVLKRGSLYHAIERLVSGGLIEPVSVGREGRRPARTTYRLTRAGEEELVTWLKQRVATIQRSPSEFMGTLSFLVHLSPADAAAQLEVRASTLERHIAESSAALAQITQFVGRINLIETEVLDSNAEGGAAVGSAHPCRSSLRQVYLGPQGDFESSACGPTAEGLAKGAPYMNAELESPAHSTQPGSRWQRVGPIVTLLVLSPVIGELMSGATRLSYIFALVPEIMVWGCGTLIIRDVVRRWRGGWTSMLLLGLGLSIAEEFIIQQTSLAPLPWLEASPAYGRVWGVNWPYFLFMLGYEAVWIVLVPVQLTELLFPERRHESWLRRSGIAISSIVFAAGALIAWFVWTQQARPRVFHVPAYHPPAEAILAGALAMVLLIASAYMARRAFQGPISGKAPRYWIVGSCAFLMGLPWYLLMVLVFGPVRQLPLLIPLLAAPAYAMAVLYVVQRWSLSSQWQDMHRWALCLGALMVCMAGGFLGAGYWPLMDIIAKVVLNLAAIVSMGWLARRIAMRACI